MPRYFNFCSKVHCFWNYLQNINVLQSCSCGQRSVFSVKYEVMTSSKAQTVSLKSEFVSFKALISLFQNLSLPWNEIFSMFQETVQVSRSKFGAHCEHLKQSSDLVKWLYLSPYRFLHSFLRFLHVSFICSSSCICLDFSTSSLC